MPGSMDLVREVDEDAKHLFLRCHRIVFVSEAGNDDNVKSTDGKRHNNKRAACACEILFDGGRLRGPIPDFIGRCFPHLLELDLSHNQLSGNIPTGTVGRPRPLISPMIQSK